MQQPNIIIIIIIIIIIMNFIFKALYMSWTSQSAKTRTGNTYVHTYNEMNCSHALNTCGKEMSL